MFLYLRLQTVLTIFVFGVFSACAMEPKAKQTNAQKVALEEDENAHLPSSKDKSENATSSNPRVRVTKNTNSASKPDASAQQKTTAEGSQQKPLTPPPADEEEIEMEEELVEEEVPAGPLVSLQAPTTPSSFKLYSQNTISVPVTAAAAGTVAFSVERTELDAVDLLGDISINLGTTSLSFSAAGETKMFNLVVGISSKSAAFGDLSFALVATPTGQTPIKLPINFTVEQQIDIQVTNIGNNTTTFTSGGQVLSAGDNLDLKDGTMVVFTNMDPNSNLRIHMIGDYHQGGAISMGQNYIPAQDFCGEAGRDNQVAYDHNNQGGDDAFMFTCIDRQ